MENLNKEQEQAVKTTEGYVRVLAGAGTGKTKTITNRYIYLVNEVGIKTKNILCITFTNNTAKEMKGRIGKQIKDEDAGYICTFHSLAAEALREDIHCINVVPNFVIIDEEDQNNVLKKVYNTLGISNEDYHYKDMKKEINKIKNENIEYVRYLAEEAGEFFENAVTIEEKFFNAYLEEQQKNAMLDYTDLINAFEYILLNFKNKRIKWQEKFRYIMCDEFNDVDAKQYNILKILSGCNKNLMIVGDPDQTIYSWRGSDVKFIINFTREFDNVQDIVINKNYRSVPSILNVANSLIKNNKNRLEKDLIATRVEKNKVIYHSLSDVNAEAKWIVEEIEKLQKNGEVLSNIAILYRNKNISRSIEEQLINKNIKYFMYNGVDFYSRKEIKDILSYLRFIIYKKDLDFERIVNSPKRGIGKKTMNMLREFSAKNNCTLYQALKYNIENDFLKKTKAKGFVRLIDKLIENYEKMNIVDLVNLIFKESGYLEDLKRKHEQERIENIEELKHSIIEYESTDIEEKTLKEYLDKISIYTDADKTSKENAVKLMTIHAAKGLEFKNVFICRANEGIIPSSKVKSSDEIEEERRVFYVAITRAMDRLYITDVQKDYSYNENKSAQFLKESDPSRFLKELDKKELEFVNQVSENRLSETTVYKNIGFKEIEMKLQMGDIVEHFVFGRGIIENVNYDEKSYTIKFDKLDTVREIDARIELKKVK